jgi:hypothetical protein
MALKLPPCKPVRVWAIDEHRYGLISHQRRCWGLRRVRPHAPYRTRYEWGYLASALEIDGKDEAFCMFLPCVNKDASACFLQQLAASDEEAIHVIIQDQAGFHLKEQDEGLPANVKLLPLPPYSPELNPVERIGDLIKDVTGKRVFKTLADMEASIEEEIKPLWSDPQRVRSLVGNGWMRSQVNAS